MPNTSTMLEITNTNAGDHKYNATITKHENSFSSRKETVEGAQPGAEAPHRALTRLGSQLRLDHALQTLHVLPPERRVVEGGGCRLLHRWREREPRGAAAHRACERTRAEAAAQVGPVHVRRRVIQDGDRRRGERARRPRRRRRQARRKRGCEVECQPGFVDAPEPDEVVV
jgi:hypothetical protein